jgi:glycosyltransferase involved in cell wall biosynthesis
VSAATVTPAVSVCVSSRNRAPLLGRLLLALEEQTLSRSDFEVVVVDDGSTDDSAHVLADAQARGVLALSTLRHESSKGPAAGRNAAWRKARAPVIAFTDDDCLPAHDWLARGLDAMGAHRRVVVGRVEPNPEQLARNGLFAHTWVMRAPETRWFATANILYRRQDLEALSGFDERYLNPACEDTDLGLRAEEDGVEVLFSAETLVWHDVRPGTVLDKVRDQARWADIPLVFRTHPGARHQMLHRGLFWKPTHRDLLLLLAGVAASKRDTRALALALPWVHRRLCAEAQDQPMSLLAPALPGLLAVDIAELVAMIRGSVRHRSLVL